MSTPATPHAQIETDFFCARCGYNLHGLPVTRDERLDLLLVRCSECGGFQPVGGGSTIATLWLQRLATLGLAAWVAVSIGTIITLGFLMGVMVFAHLEISTMYGRWTNDGRIAVYDMTRGGFAFYPSMTPLTDAEQTALNGQRYAVQAKQPRVAKPMNQLLADAPAIFIMPALLFALSAMLGGGFAIIGWHWPRGRAKWALVLPPITLLFTLVVWLSGYDPRTSLPYFMSLIAMLLVLMLIACATGLRLGRPTARGLTRLFIPAKPRQILSFLWTADGLTMPGPVAKA